MSAQIILLSDYALNTSFSDAVKRQNFIDNIQPQAPLLADDLDFMTDNAATCDLKHI